MFPHDVVANAPRIISDLRTIFPPQQGTFLIGPMAKLGWGTPTLVSLSLGVIIEIPGNVAILGVLELALPTDGRSPIIVLQVELRRRDRVRQASASTSSPRCSTRASSSSRSRARWALLVACRRRRELRRSASAASTRAFTPPPLPFPSPKRIALVILNEDVARIRAETYFAVTTNTVQFGARAELYFGFSAFSVAGPLRLRRAVPVLAVLLHRRDLGVVLAEGVRGRRVQRRARSQLEGPTPWHAHGTGSISLLFFVDLRRLRRDVGRAARHDAAADRGAARCSRASSTSTRAGRALLPARRQPARLAAPARSGGAGRSCCTRSATLRVSQRRCRSTSRSPRSAQQRPTDANRFSLSVAGGGLAKIADATEQFAPAQFHDLSTTPPSSRARRSSRCRGGRRARRAGAQRTRRRTRSLASCATSEVIIDTNFRRFQRRFGRFPGLLFTHFLAGNAVARSARSRARQGRAAAVRRRRRGDAARRTSSPTTADNSRASQRRSRARRRRATTSRRRSRPTRASTDDLHVIPAFEAAA